MINYYSLADILINIFEAIFAFMIFNTYLEKREELSHYIYILGGVLTSLMFAASNHIFHFGFLNAVGMISVAFLFSWLYKGRLSTRILFSAITFLLIAIIEIVILFLMASVMQRSVTEIVDGAQLRLLGSMMSKLTTFVVIKLICTKSRRPSIFTTSHWILFFIIFATSILAVFLLFKFQYDSANRDMFMLSVVCAIGLLCSMFFTLYLYENMAIQAEEINRQRIFEQQVTMQAKHMDEILLAQKELKTFKHDLKNHMVALNSYFEKSNDKECLDYIEKLKDMSALNNGEIDTGNIALDAIINSKKSVAKGKGINLVTNIQIPENLPIEPTDICIIFGNALDNALEACDKVEDRIKNIALSIIYEDNSIFCKIANTSPTDKSLKLETTKKDKKNHGFGIDNIKTALAKYKNIFKITQTDGEFVLFFVIYHQ